jgi:O-antigen/teichoic acid export membrane protein
LTAAELPPGADSTGETDDLLSTAAAGTAAVRGGAVRVGGFILATLVSILSAALLFRHLGLRETAQYVLALSLVAIVGSLSDLGLTAVGVRELSRLPPEERWPLARDLLGLRITLTVLGSVIVTLLAWVAYSATLADGVALACVGLLLQATQDNFALPLVVDLRLAWVSALEVTRQLLTTASTIALVLLGATLVPFLAISIPVGIVVLIATVVLVRGVRSLVPTFSWRRWRRFMGAMLPYSAATAASALYFRVSILLVSALSSEKQFSYFSATFRIIEVLTLVPALLASSAFPIFARAARDDHERLSYAIGKVFDVSLIVGAWVAVSTAVGAPLAIAIVGGPKFAAAAPVLAIQGVGLGAMFVSLVWAYALLSLGLYRAILTISVSALLVNVLLVTPLVLVDGARGAAIGTGVAEILVGIAQCVAVVRANPQLRPALAVLPRVAVAAALGLAPLALSGVPTIARLCISTVVFGSFLLVTRAFPPELLDLIPGAGARRAAAGGGT